MMVVGGATRELVSFEKENRNDDAMWFWLLFQSAFILSLSLSLSLSQLSLRTNFLCSSPAAFLLSD
jgi:hypothetical protein